MADDCEGAIDQMDYWLPSWWGWIDSWSRCRTCLKYNGSPCASCELPPGLLGIVCLVGGGTEVVAGNMRGNVSIANQQQAAAASRMDRGHPASQKRQININVNANINRNKLKRDRQ